MKLLDVFDNYPDALKIAELLKAKNIETVMYYLASDQNTSLNEYQLDPQLSVLRVSNTVGHDKPWAPNREEVKCSLWVVEDTQYNLAGNLLIEQHRQPVTGLNPEEFAKLFMNKANYSYIPTTSFDNDATPRVNVFTCISVQAVLGVFALLYFTWFDLSMRTALVFLLGVFAQSYQMMRGVTGLLSALNNMGAAISASFIATAITLPIMGNIAFTIIFCIAYMLIFSILFTRKFLFILTQQSFVLFNILFIIYCTPYATAAIHSAYHVTALMVSFSILAVSAIAIFLSYGGNYILPLKIKNIGTFFYIWYSIISALLLIIFIVETLDGSGYSNASLLTIFLISMLWMRVLQVLVSLYVCVIAGATKLLGDKYVCNENMMLKGLLVPVVILVLLLNHQVLHINQLLLVNIILILDSYLSDRYIKKQ